MVEVYCAVRFFATVPDAQGKDGANGKKRIDLLSKLKLEDVETAIRKALPGDRPIAALYQDADQHGPVLLVRICISE